MRTYGDEAGDQQYEGLFRELEGIEGVELLGPLNQEALYREYARASIFFYPCIWPETYCLAMDEAIAHGCSIVTYRLGALPERQYGFISDILAASVIVCLNGNSNVNQPPPPFNEFDPKAFHGHPPRDWLDVARQWEAEVLA